LSGQRTPTEQFEKDLQGYELVLGVSGCIAAYKLCVVVSALVQRACGVTVAMTDAATRFVGPTTFQALTGRRVFTSLWQAEDYYDPQHLSLARGADLMLIAPATGNIIGKIAGGIADDLVSTMVMGANCPVVLAPAMNQQMWRNPIVQENAGKLEKLGYGLIAPIEGWLACGEVGPGRLAEPETIISVVADRLKGAPPRQRP
jgi:phosphopantothenoylcysteine decarboxylase/phosphopantothenate--cysteine ligase